MARALLLMALLFAVVCLAIWGIYKARARIKERRITEEHETKRARLDRDEEALRQAEREWEDRRR